MQTQALGLLCGASLHDVDSLGFLAGVFKVVALPVKFRLSVIFRSYRNHAITVLLLVPVSRDRNLSGIAFI